MLPVRSRLLKAPEKSITGLKMRAGDAVINGIFRHAVTIYKQNSKANYKHAGAHIPLKEIYVLI